MDVQITYLHEHLLIGNLGHFLTALGFGAALLSGLLYLSPVKSHERIARGAYSLHVLSVVGVFVALFVIIQRHYFEYAYAYQHSSITLPLHYMVSCFWEGQEGSFLLWIVWNALIGLVLMFTARKWERSVMPILALAQLILLSMILGVSLGDSYTLGSSPFTLLRDKFAGTAPLFNDPNYLNHIVDGTGLNPLLQNYWMVIHPPTLFLGFALTIVPFAFAVGGLFRKEHRAWIRPALPWALAAGMILGAGIIMGGFWAYESLSFGGYWAWDPVENASLVPWLLLIAGIHLMLVKRVTNTATIASYLLIIASFIFVLYATFLTRSGVLGETSVHSFTDLGLAGQLMQLVVVFVWLPIFGVSRKKPLRLLLAGVIGLIVILLPFYTRMTFYPLLAFSVIGLVWFALQLNKELDPLASEDNVWSREFWMFIGSLILVLSAMQVTITTSIPVFNKIFGLSAAPPADAIAHYNKWQLPFAVLIGLLTALSQYFQYRNTPDRTGFKRETLNLLTLAALSTLGGSVLFGIRNPVFITFLASSSYAVIANLWYVVRHVRKFRNAGASITHLGFGLMLIGVLVSSAKKQIITADFTGGLANYVEKDRAENMMLKLGQTERLADYLVTYLGDSSKGPDIYSKIHYKRLDGKEEFTLYPNSQLSERDGLMSNPDTRHYLTHDIYTYISAKPSQPDSLDYGKTEEYRIGVGDSLKLENGTVVFKGVDVSTEQEDTRLKDIILSRAELEVIRNGERYTAYPMHFLHTQLGAGDEGFELKEAGMFLRFFIAFDDGKYQSVIAVRQAPVPEKYVVMKAIKFPYINLLWLGTILMLIGFGIATYNRLELKRGT